jgi:hypothetical protein
MEILPLFRFLHVQGTLKTRPRLIVFGLIGITLSCVSAKAGQIFDFSFSNTDGTVPGTVTGTITLPVICSPTCAATDVTLTGFPSALNSPYGSPPIDIFVNAGSIASNTFSVSGGNISTATFSASLSIGGGAFFITTDTTSANQLFFALPTPPQPPNITLCQNSAAATCVTFTPGGTGSVPEPDTWATLVLGLSGLAWVALRRRPNRG